MALTCGPIKPGDFSSSDTADPARVEAHLENGLKCLEAGKLTLALGELNLLLSLKLPGAKRADLYNVLGLVYYNMGKVNKSLEALRKAVRLAPRNAKIIMALGLIEFAVGRNSLAVADLKRAAEIEPGNAEIVYNLGLAMFKKAGKTDDYAKVRSFLKNAIADPRFAFSREEKEAIYLILAQAASKASPLSVKGANQNLNDSDKYSSACLEINPDNARCLVVRAGAYWEYGYVLSRPGQKGRAYWLNIAISDYEKAARLDPKQLSAIEPRLAEAYVGTGDYIKALMIYEKFYAEVAARTDKTPLFFYGQDPMINTALEEMAVALKGKKSLSPKEKILLGRGLLLLGKREEAASLLGRVLKDF